MGQKVNHRKLVFGQYNPPPPAPKQKIYNGHVCITWNPKSKHFCFLFSHAWNPTNCLSEKYAPAPAATNIKWLLTCYLCLYMLTGLFLHQWKACYLNRSWTLQAATFLLPSGLALTPDILHSRYSYNTEKHKLQVTYLTWNVVRNKIWP